jgi:alkanesulfonate monooxygenase SsuD/methylene tetrahydromethanopterin reductase-like flavin-dependent oxidoreductase (luciferase family)
MHTREQIIECAVLADELGYHSVLVPEAWGYDSTVLLTEIALNTKQIRPVSAILSIWGRTPATIAMSAATLHDVSDGRYILGLGASTPSIVDGFHDVRYHRPAAEMERVLAEVSNLLGGGRANLTHATDARPLRLGLPGPHEVDIVVAGMGPRLRRIASLQASGWVPVFLSREFAATQLDEIRQMRSEAGLDNDAFIPLIPPGVVIDPDVERGRAAGASNLAFYLCAMGDNYSRLLTEQGFGEEVQAVIAANPRPRPGACVVPDELTRLWDEFLHVVPPEEAATALAPWDELGAVSGIGLPPMVPTDTLLEVIRGAAPPR